LGWGVSTTSEHWLESRRFLSHWGITMGWTHIGWQEKQAHRGLAID
jgi:hypothetical protein